MDDAQEPKGMTVKSGVKIEFEGDFGSCGVK